MVTPGTVIGSITFRRYNVFNLNDPKESNWLYSLANQLHIVTRESVIREQLLFAEGDYYIRARLEERLGIARATRVPVLYGGSVKPGNAAELLSAPDVDGVLVGGASLDAESYANIVAASG